MNNPSDNPFASPVETSRGRRRWGPVPVRSPGSKATLLRKSILYRRIEVEAPVKAVVEYVGRTLRDKIIVNGEIVDWRLPVIGLSHTFRFHINTEQESIPATVDVRVNSFAQITFFDLEIDGISVYREDKKAG